MYVKVEEVREKIKKYFYSCIDAGLKEIDVVDCAVELQQVIDTVPGVAEDTSSTASGPPSPQGEGYEE